MVVGGAIATAAAGGRADGAPPGTAPTPGAGDGRESRRRLLAELETLVTQRALAVEDPWVLMHAVLPLGAEARFRDEPALDVVARQWIKPVARGSNTYPAFPLEIESHPNHFLEVMYATGVPSDRAFTTASGRFTRADLYRAARALFTPATDGSELSWTVSVFTAEMPPDADRFENAEGRPFTVAALVEAATQAAEVGYADTVAAMQGTKPYGRSALQGYACNGTHVVYGLLDALRHGYRGRDLALRTQRLLQAAIYRLGAEVDLIDRVLGASAEPLARLNADAAKLQFLGHSLENLAYAERNRLYTSSATEREAIAAAERELAALVHRLSTVHDLDGLARQVPRAYRVLLGDACHALRGLRI
jgi:hypothetical protein